MRFLKNSIILVLIIFFIWLFCKVGGILFLFMYVFVFAVFMMIDIYSFIRLHKAIPDKNEDNVKIESINLAVELDLLAKKSNLNKLQFYLNTLISSLRKNILWLIYMIYGIIFYHKSGGEGRFNLNMRIQFSNHLSLYPTHFYDCIFVLLFLLIVYFSIGSISLVSIKIITFLGVLFTLILISEISLGGGVFKAYKNSVRKIYTNIFGIVFLLTISVSILTSIIQADFAPDKFSISLLIQNSKDLISLRSLKELYYSNSLKSFANEMWSLNWNDKIKIIYSSLFFLTIVAGVKSLGNYKREDKNFKNIAKKFLIIGQPKKAEIWLKKATNRDLKYFYLKSNLCLSLNEIDKAYENMDILFKGLEMEVSRDEILSSIITLGIKFNVESDSYRELLIFWLKNDEVDDIKFYTSSTIAIIKSDITWKEINQMIDKLNVKDRVSFTAAMSYLYRLLDSVEDESDDEQVRIFYNQEIQKFIDKYEGSNFYHYSSLAIIIVIYKFLTFVDDSEITDELIEDFRNMLNDFQIYFKNINSKFDTSLILNLFFTASEIAKNGKPGIYSEMKSCYESLKPLTIGNSSFDFEKAIKRVEQFS